MASICRVSWRRGTGRREQRFRESNRDSEIRASETFQNRIRDADHFSFTIEEGTAGTSGGGLRVEDNFVGQDVSDVALRDNRMYQIAACQLRQDLRNVAATAGQYLLCRDFIRPRQDTRKPRRIAH